MDEEVIYIRTSERAKWRQCRQAWWWSHIDRLQAPVSKPALRFGGLVHAAFAYWYKPGRIRGTKPWIAFDKLYLEQINAGMRDFNIRLDADEGWIEARELGNAMLHHYVEHWGNDDHIEVISPEFPFQIWMTDKRGNTLRVLGLDGRKHPVRYVGRFDLLYRNLNTLQIGLMETKTAASISTSHLPLDEQAGSYWAMAPLILPEHKWKGKPILRPGQDIDFIMYNFLRKAMPDERPVDEQGHRLNKNGTVSKRQPPPFFHRQPVYRDDADRQNLLTRIRMEAYEMGLVRAGKLPVYKNPAGTWPDQHCNGCQFRDMCELHETGADWEEFRDFNMTQWDPYADHNQEDWEIDDEATQ